MTHNSISTTKAPAAIGPYSQAVKAGTMIFLSGQLGINPETGMLVSGGVSEQTEQVLKNIQAILLEAGASLKQVVKTTVFLANMDDFSEMNTVYASYFTEFLPARSTVAVKTLPKNGLVEIEVIAINE